MEIVNLIHFIKLSLLFVMAISLVGFVFAVESDVVVQVEQISGPSAVSCSDGKITVVIETDDYGSETIWKVIEMSTGDTVASGGPFADGNNGSHVVETCVSSSKCYSFTIYDEYGDGICCEYGEGAYRVYYNGVLKGSGGDFYASETVTFGGGCDGLTTPNDECVNAIAVNVDVPYVGNTINAGGLDVTDCVDGDTKDVWHSFMPETTAEYTISLCGSAFDTSLAVFSGCSGAMLMCNDDYCDTQSQLEIELAGKVRYLIRIAGYKGETGSYTLNVSENICWPAVAADRPRPDNGQVEVDTKTALAWNGRQLPAAPVGTDRPSRVVYGDDDRLEEYQIINAAVLAAGDATVAILTMSDMINNWDGTYNMSDETLAQYYQSAYGRPLCSDEPFRNQPDPAWCSGFLVAPDIIATAAHCIVNSGECSNAVFVFGFVMQDASTPVITIDSSQIYHCSEIIERVETSSGPDWALIRLDREVPDHTPLGIRRSGQVADGSELMIIGHPWGLPRKYAANATVRGNSDSACFEANLDSFSGNSGSVVLNRGTMQVEGILVRGNEDFVADGECDRTNVCPDSGCPGFEDVTRATEFSEYVPAFDVYLSDNPDSLELVASDVFSSACDPGTLQCGTTYYWQVLLKGGCTQTLSEVFFFTTAPAGDLNANCNVDFLDFAKFAAHWKSMDCGPANRYCDGADINKNGEVGLVDLAILAHNWLGIYP